MVGGMKKTDEKQTKNNAKVPAKALARFAAVSWIKERNRDTLPKGTTLSGILKDAAARDWSGFRFGASTLERYYYAWQKGGFDALLDRKRSDADRLRTLSEEMADLLLAERRAHPELDVTVLLDMLREDKGVDVLAECSLSTVYRLLRHHGLDSNTMRFTQGDPGYGPQKCFEMPAVNMLWMTDMMHGPILVTPEGKRIHSRLFAFMDDHSRLCVGAEYFASESFDCVLKVLREAIARRGIPDKIYTDQGKVFTCLHMKTICANMGIRLSHARPYHAWSKGKIERWFRTVQKQFQARLSHKPARSLEELNERFNRWIENSYHTCVHSATGATPADRFAAGVEGIRNPPAGDQLDALFKKSVTRRVTRDACVSVEAKCFEAPLSLRGLKVEVRHTVPLGDTVEIYHQGKLISIGVLVNKNLNATQFHRSKI